MEEFRMSDYDLSIAFDHAMSEMADLRYSADELIPNLESLISAFAEGYSDWHKHIGPTVASAVRMRSKIVYGAELTYTDSFVMVFIKKQQDYGPYNIAKFGEAGIIVRLSDKLERIKHLMKTGMQPNNEPFVDTIIDIANYCVILHLVLNNKWQMKCNHYKLKIEE